MADFDWSWNIRSGRHRLYGWVVTLSWPRRRQLFIGIKVKEKRNG